MLEPALDRIGRRASWSLVALIAALGACGGKVNADDPAKSSVGGVAVARGGRSSGGSMVVSGGAPATGGSAPSGGAGGGSIVDCPLGETLCASGCANLAVDSSHCGACGVVCSAVNGSASCVDGQCTIACGEGYGDCDQNAANGCEALLASDANNCGACGKACYAGERCVSSYCEGPTVPPDTGTPPAGCIPTWFKQQINLLVLHDANVSNGSTRGAMWVGGALTGLGYDVGGDLPADCSRYDLVVGGNVNLSGWLVLHNGAAIYGGSLDASGVQGNSCGMFPAASAPMPMPDFRQIAPDVRANSAYFAGLQATGSESGTTLDGSSGPCKIAVFNTTLCSFAGVTIDLPAGGTAIVNSTCATPTLGDGQTTVIMGGVTQAQCDGPQGTGQACNRVLYNFPQATTVTVNGLSVQGSILAPYAKLVGTSGNVAGEVIVDSLDTGIEFRAWFFEGCLDTSTC